LDSTGYATELGKSSWKIMKGVMVIARGIKSGTLYTIAECMNMTVVAKSASNWSLWHNRLRHMSVKEMKMLAAKRVLEGLKSVDVGRCENYVMSKQKRVSFTRTARELKCGWKWSIQMWSKVPKALSKLELSLSCRETHLVML